MDIVYMFIQSLPCHFVGAVVARPRPCTPGMQDSQRPFPQKTKLQQRALDVESTVEELRHAFDAAKEMGVTGNDKVFADVSQFLAKVDLERAFRAYSKNKLGREQLQHVFDAAKEAGLAADHYLCKIVEFILSAMSLLDSFDSKANAGTDATTFKIWDLGGQEV